MRKQKEFTLIEILVILAVLIITAAAGVVAVSAVKQVLEEKTAGIEKSQVKISPTPSFSPEQEGFAQQEPLLKILPPKERAELENAIRQTQEVLQNIKVFNFSPPTAEDVKKGLNQINKPSPKQTPTLSPIDPQKIEEYFNQNPPAVPQDGKEFSPAEKEYYYRKYILKDPAFQ